MNFRLIHVCDQVVLLKITEKCDSQLAYRLNFHCSLMSGLPSPRLQGKSAGSFPEHQLVMEPSRHKANNFFPVFFSIVESGGITKLLMTGPAVNSVLFLLDLNVPLGFTSGNIKGLGESKLTVSLGANH